MQARNAQSSNKDTSRAVEVSTESGKCRNGQSPATITTKQARCNERTFTTTLRAFLTGTRLGSAAADSFPALNFLAKSEAESYAGTAAKAEHCSRWVFARQFARQFGHKVFRVRRRIKGK